MKAPFPFHTIQTGGGCTAWTNEENTIIIIDGPSLSAPDNMECGCEVYVGETPQDVDEATPVEFNRVHEAMDYLRDKGLI